MEIGYWFFPTLTVLGFPTPTMLALSKGSSWLMLLLYLKLCARWPWRLLLLPHTWAIIPPVLVLSMELPWQTLLMMLDRATIITTLALGVDMAGLVRVLAVVVGWMFCGNGFRATNKVDWLSYPVIPIYDHRCLCYPWNYRDSRYCWCSIGLPLLQLLPWE